MNATVIYDNKPKAIELNLTGQDNRCVSFFEGEGHWQRGVKGKTLQPHKQRGGYRYRYLYR